MSKISVLCAVVLSVLVFQTCTAQSAEEKKIIRIKAGSEKPIKDKEGNEWQKDTGFADGNVEDRAGIKIENTRIPEVYTSERWGMTAYALPVPNGTYTVKLHFAETYDGISAADMRVFDVNVEGTDIKNLDVFKEAGGGLKALVKTVKVEVKDGKLNIKFTPHDDKNNPEINGIEIIPE